MIMNWIDRAGTCASSLCAVHCCAMPFLIGILPVLGVGFLATSWFEWFMIAVAGLLGGYGAVSGFRTHQKSTAVLLFATGILMLISNRIVHAATSTEACCALHDVSQEGIPLQVLPSVVGGVLVASSHIVNQYLCKNCEKCDNYSCTDNV